MKPLQAWIKVAVFETLLGDWQQCGGNVAALYKRLRAAFEYAVGPEFDLSAYETLESEKRLYNCWIRTYKLDRGSQKRGDFKRRQFQDMLDEWVESQLPFITPPQRKKEWKKLSGKINKKHRGRVSNLLSAKWQKDRYREGLDELGTVEPEYDVRKFLIKYWKDHSLLAYKTDWLKIADSKTFDFGRTSISTGLFEHYINNFFVKSMSNEKVESIFNLVNIYGDVQLDPVRQEYILVYVAGTLAKEQEKRRRAKYRAKEGKAKAEGKKLVKHAWNKEQLAALAQSAVEKSQLLTPANLVAATGEANLRVKEQKRQREGRFHGRLDGEYTVDRIIDERRVGDQVEYLVVWHGFEHEDDHSWEPLDAVCEAEALDVWIAKRPRVDSDEE